VAAFEFSDTKIFYFAEAGFDDSEGIKVDKGLPFIAAILLAQHKDTEELCFATSKMTAGNRILAKVAGV
jgi:hypothetical protein